MKKYATIVAFGCLIALGSAGSAFAQFTLEPQIWDPDNACPGVTSQWQNGAILLAKPCPTATNAAAIVDIVSPLEGGSITALTELNFDVQGYCGAGAPRFNVVVDGTFYFLGCNSGTHTDLGNGFTHVVFTAADFAAAGIPTTGTLTDLWIVLDEMGTATIDNISVNGDVVGDQVSDKPTSADQCKNGGWKTFTNPAFKNQGQCVSFVVSHRGGNGKH